MMYVVSTTWVTVKSNVTRLDSLTGMSVLRSVGALLSAQLMPVAAATRGFRMTAFIVLLRRAPAAASLAGVFTVTLVGVPGLLVAAVALLAAGAFGSGHSEGTTAKRFSLLTMGRFS
jgi:hypothetical protein